MSAIFISYRRDDSAAYAGRMYDVLAQHFGRERVFLDIDAIGPGEDFREVVERTLAASSVVLAVIGRQWVTITDRTGRVRLQNQTDTLRLEISSALARKGLKVIPVLVDGATMPEESSLPEDLQALAYRNAAEVSAKRFHQDMEELVKALKKIVGSGQPALPLSGKPLPSIDDKPLLPLQINYITLGRTMVGELEAIGFRTLEADDYVSYPYIVPAEHKFHFSRDLNFDYDTKTGIFHTVQFSKGEALDFPPDWRALGFHISNSYQDWVATFKRLDPRAAIWEAEFGPGGRMSGRLACKRPPYEIRMLFVPGTRPGLNDLGWWITYTVRDQ